MKENVIRNERKESKREGGGGGLFRDMIVRDVCGFTGFIVFIELGHGALMFPQKAMMVNYKRSGILK